MEKGNAKTLVEKCPYWDLGSKKECGMSKGGMYIPMPDHVTMFCLSTMFSKCHQYIKGCELAMARSEYEDNGLLRDEERRRLKRYQEELCLDLVACDKNLWPHGMINHKAKTIDVSLGGLRLESSQEFSTDTVISFVMDPEFSSESLIGVGEVKWCMPKKESDSFESGIAFSNYSTSEGVKEYLKL